MNLVQIGLSNEGGATHNWENEQPHSNIKTPGKPFVLVPWIQGCQMAESVRPKRRYLEITRGRNTRIR